MSIPKDGDFSKLLDGGENPYGFTAQTANGTLRDGRGGDGEPWQAWPMADGPRWNGDPRAEAPVLDGQPSVIAVRSHTRRRG